jgi:drug/metabolite transporter (DMT)-like permease
MAEAEASGSRRNADAYVYLALMVVIGSTTASAAKFAVRELPIGLLPPIRFGVAGLCLLPLIRTPGFLRRMLRESPVRLLLAAALCVPINQPFFLYGTELAPTTHVGLIYAWCPLVVLALALAIGQERLVPSRIGGIAACVLGVLVVGIGNLWHPTPESAAQFSGDLLLMGAVVTWGIYLTVSKPLIDHHGAFPALAATFLVGSVLDLPIAAASLGRWPAALTASTTAWSSFVFLTLGQSVLGLACQNQALRRLDASQVAAVGNAAPLLTILWGVWLLREPFPPTLVLGGLLTAFGIIWISRPVRTRNPGALADTLISAENSGGRNDASLGAETARSETEAF